MFQRCLICTDLTDGLQRLVAEVESLAHSGLTEITFLHSVPLWEEGQVPRVDMEKIEWAKEKLFSPLTYSGDHLKVNIEVISGNVVDNILKIVQKYTPDFIITGTPLRSSLQERIFGSTTMDLSKKVKIPVMILRPQLISVYTTEEIKLRCSKLNNYWLIPCYDVDNARYLLEQIKLYATEKPSKVKHKYLILAVIDDVSRSELIVKNSVKDAQQKLAEVKKDLESFGLEVEVLVTTGNPLQETLNTALIYDIQAIAIADDQDSLLDWTVKSFTQEVLHRSWFPVVFFPFKKSEK
ncbi:universal stress protein [Geminocystis sp. GBBB08]|uniref:universal stress protein n=1 Tax=Geminocystis sp. GBBB08 TaxID=2604140 RepID=UPI0027E37B2D|nr:universal stress protein [Geminocystis sp. GBBB08]MBL1211552.1 universal stress protein [Geminocystis sp. GBBB08]